MVIDEDLRRFFLSDLRHRSHQNKLWNIGGDDAIKQMAAVFVEWVADASVDMTLGELMDVVGEQVSAMKLQPDEQADD